MERLSTKLEQLGMQLLEVENALVYVTQQDGAPPTKREKRTLSHFFGN